MNAEAAPFVPNGDVSPSPGDDSSPEGRPNALRRAIAEQVWRPQYRGRIRSFSEHKGFGFIDCPETYRAFSRDVFIHRFQMSESGLKAGMDVVFQVELNKMGHPQARCVRAYSAADHAADVNWHPGMNVGVDVPGYDGCMMVPPYASSYPVPIMERMGGPYQCTESWRMASMLGAPSYGQANGADAPGSEGTPSTGPEQIEAMLLACRNSQEVWDVVGHYGHTFGRKHMVSCLHRLGLCRQYERRTDPQDNSSGIAALIDRLALIPAKDITPDEAPRVLLALATLDEVSGQEKAHRFAMELGEQAAKRYTEFTPAQMAFILTYLTKLVLTSEEDELVGKITTDFSCFAFGDNGVPRFAPEELRVWGDFLCNQSQGDRHVMVPVMPRGGAPPGFMHPHPWPPMASRSVRGSMVHPDLWWGPPPRGKGLGHDGLGPHEGPHVPMWFYGGHNPWGPGHRGSGNHPAMGTWAGHGHHARRPPVPSNAAAVEGADQSGKGSGAGGGRLVSSPPSADSGGKGTGAGGGRVMPGPSGADSGPAKSNNANA